MELQVSTSQATIIIGETNTQLTLDIPPEGLLLKNSENFNPALAYRRKGQPVNGDDEVQPGDRIYAAHPSDNG